MVFVPGFLKKGDFNPQLVDCDPTILELLCPRADNHCVMVILCIATCNLQVATQGRVLRSRVATTRSVLASGLLWDRILWYGTCSAKILVATQTFSREYQANGGCK